MNEDISDRVISIKRALPLRPDVTLGDLSETTPGRKFASNTVEKPWLNDEPNKSCIPFGRYPVRWRWSEKHQRNLYHIDDVPGRSNCEFHAANVQLQLLGCIAQGKAVALFKAGSIHPDQNFPPMDCWGVTESGTTLEAFHKNMQDANGKQMNFWLVIE